MALEVDINVIERIVGEELVVKVQLVLILNSAGHYAWNSSSCSIPAAHFSRRLWPQQKCQLS